MILLLGRRDVPTDGVEDYCRCLAQALQDRGVGAELARIGWAEAGWIRALRKLWSEGAGWRESWVLLQYTTMAWSRRGFPFGALAALAILRCHELRCAVVFHEPFRQDGGRWINRFRGSCQDWVIRKLYRGATRAIFVDPLEKIAWLPTGESKAVFIPIGANIPEARPEFASMQNRHGDAKTVAVFCLSDPPNRQRELGDIAHAMRFLAQQGLRARVLFLGRGTSEAREGIERAFRSASIEVVNLGLQSADDVSRILCESDAMLCVRGPLYPRRGSAIAGIACGLPIVAYAGEVEGTPLAEAGVELIPYGDRDALGKALAHVLESGTWSKLRQKSLAAHRRYFSWEVVAARVQESLSQQERARG
jgi:glycosyltransferase involved in cell wall biosynthesis